MRNPAFCSAFLVAVVSTGLLSAQPSRTPEVGSQLPVVSAFDENGKPFSTDQLRGSYSVLVFGCLT